MRDGIQKILDDWDDHSCRQIYFQLLHLEKHLYSTYEPTLAPNLQFWDRLENCLRELADVDNQKILFKNIPELTYLGPEEMVSLYKYAYETILVRWICATSDLKLSDNLLESKITDEVRNTWFCPVTDSMRINKFYHVNNIPSRQSFRPDWRSLGKFGDLDRIQAYIEKESITRLVLLEDFVGGGGQIKKTIEFASHFKTSVEILVIPLVICPNGFSTLTSIATSNQIYFEPVMQLSKSSFIDLDDELCQLAVSTYEKITGNPASDIEDKSKAPYHFLGWDKTGALVVMNTNTPNNTLPVYHYTSDTWSPLFPRHVRD